MQKICSITWKDFLIRDQDIDIYKRLWVSLPNISPEERQKTRMAWRNDRVFYHRKCDFSGKPIIAMYPEKTLYPVYHPDIWWSDQWDAMDYGIEYDESKSFFEQWYELLKKVPRPWVDLVNCENSLYCNYCWDDNVDGTFVYHSENMYECISCYKSFWLQFCKKVSDSSNCYFSYDLKGCNNCFLSSGLRNKSYCIENKQYTKDEYEKIISDINLWDYEVYTTDLMYEHAKILHISMMFWRQRNVSISTIPSIIQKGQLNSYQLSISNYQLSMLLVTFLRASFIANNVTIQITCLAVSDFKIKNTAYSTRNIQKKNMKPLSQK